MARVRHAMSAPAAVVLPDATLEETARHMADERVGALPVVEGDQVIGLVTDRDLVVRAMAHGLPPGLRVETVMSSDPIVVDADTTVPAAAHAMRSAEVRHLPVVDGGRLVGMVSFDDLLWYLTVQLAELGAVVEAVRKIPGPHTGHGQPAPDTP